MITSEEIDDIWDSLNPTGLYQRLQIVYLNSVLFQVASVVLIFVIIGHVPDFTCSHLHEPLSQYGIPYSDENGSDYLVNYGKCEISIQKNGTNSTLQMAYTLPCKEGYSFDDSDGANIITEWNLVCDKSGVGELGQTLVMAGKILGATFFTFLADRYGRKPVLVSTHLMLFISSLALTFVPTFLVFAIVRFVIGALQQGTALSSSIMTIEMVPHRYRAFLGIVAHFVWSGYILILAGIGYIMRKLTWRYIQLATALVSVHAIASYWIVDESLRWSILNKRTEEARRVLEKVVKLNNVSGDKLREVTELLERHGLTNTVPCNNGPIGNNEANGSLTATETIQRILEEETFDTTDRSNISYSSRKPTFLDILQHKLLLRYSVILWFSWFVNSLTYFGLYLSSISIAGNRHLTFFLNGLVELPGGIVFAFLINRTGRKKCCVILHAVAGVSLITSVLIEGLEVENSTLLSLSVILNYVGKLTISASFGLLFLYTQELYPTNLRTFGFGVCSTAARIGGMITSYSNLFASYVAWGPGVVFGICCVLVSVLSLALPETRGKELPQTIDEYNDWVKKRRTNRRKHMSNLAINTNSALTTI